MIQYSIGCPKYVFKSRILSFGRSSLNKVSDSNPIKNQGMQEEMKGRTPVCITCKHFIFAYGPLMCNAFSEGIPDKIWRI